MVPVRANKTRPPAIIATISATYDEKIEGERVICWARKTTVGFANIKARCLAKVRALACRFQKVHTLAALSMASTRSVVIHCNGEASPPLECTILR